MNQRKSLINVCLGVDIQIDAAFVQSIDDELPLRSVLRDAGLRAVVRTLADSRAAESGIEWWLFDTAAAATAIDAAQQMLAPREAFDRNGHADEHAQPLVKEATDQYCCCNR